MPLMFIHGVNVRDRKATIHDALVLADALARMVVGPLAREQVGRLARIGIWPAARMFVPFWGDVGVQFRWNLKSLPTVRLRNILGGEAVPPGAPLPGQAEALAELLGSAGHAPDVANPLLHAARADLGRFLGVIFAPTIYQGEPLLVDEVARLPERPSAVDAARDAGTRGEALLVDTLHDLASDPSALQAVQAATDDTELLQRLQQLLLGRLQERVEQKPSENPPEAATAHGGQAMGPSPQSWAEWFGDVKERVSEVFGRVQNAPSRVLTVSTLTFKRAQLNENLTRFTGDVFEYLRNRDVQGRPGPIIQRVLDEIDAAGAAGLNEPWFVVTHSMGGNIFYDVITHYRPSLDVEVWLSVGGQVGLFEEMKLFHASDPKIQLPQLVTPHGAKVGCWLNVYDPADPFAYLARPVFQTVAADIPFSTGAGGTSSHSAYFKQRSFFDTIQADLRAAYSARSAAAAKPGTPQP